MTTMIPLDQMTRAEKVRIMNEIWADLSKEPAEMESPSWHEDVLRERDERYKAGLEKPLDWETVKTELRNRCRIP